MRNALRPLAPQSAHRADWEGDVAAKLCELLDCPNGDAQGFMEARPDDVDDLYLNGTDPDDAAAWLVERSNAGEASR